MSDDADKAAADEARAMAKFEAQLCAAFDQGGRSLDPTLPVQCVDCSAVISAARLAAQPRANRCTTCAAELEDRYALGRPL